MLLVASSDSEVFANDLTVLSFVSRRKEGRREGTIPLFSSLYSQILLFEVQKLTLPLFLKSNSKSRRTRLQQILSLVMANIFKLRLINEQQTTDTLRCSVFLARFNVERRDEEERERARGKTDGKKRDFSGGVAACNQGPDE